MSPTPRKIAYIHTLHAWRAMPASYDPAKVSAVDSREDNAIRTPRADLDPLRASSASQWEMAVETSEGETRERAEEDMEAALDAWDEAIRLLSDGNGGPSDKHEIVAQIEGARRLAKEWGEDDRERAALAMLAPS